MKNLRILRIKNVKFSGYSFYMNPNIRQKFQICISVPLSLKENTYLLLLLNIYSTKNSRILALLCMCCFNVWMWSLHYYRQQSSSWTKGSRSRAGFPVRTARVATPPIFVRADLPLPSCTDMYAFKAVPLPFAYVISLPQNIIQLTLSSL